MQKALGTEGPWCVVPPTKDKEMEYLEAFLDALDEGRVTIEPRAP